MCKKDLEAIVMLIATDDDFLAEFNKAPWIA